jgi:4-amino-4-deoxy-L-arabinose transferase-like glycosyltransferase
MTGAATSVGTAPRLSGDNVSARTLWWVGAAVLCVWFLTLDARHLLRSDEGRYAEIAREMFVTGDWVTIRYNGLKYFEKPPFHLWMTAIAYHLFGVGEWQARLWVAVSGLAGMLVSMLAARRWFGPRVALLTGLVLIATPTWVLGSRFNSLDMSVSGALACVLAGFLMAQHPLTLPGARRAWMYFSWLAIGIAVLTKGLIGMALPGLVLTVYMLATRDWGLWRRLHMPGGLILLAVITVPWFVLVSLRNPEFPQFFFIHEHWDRYTSTVHNRGEPVWYFVPQLLAGFLPWLGLSGGIVTAVRQEVRDGGFRPLLLLATWAGAIFVFFSLSGSKLPGYIIPIFPALGILAAVALDRLTPKAWRFQVTVMLVLAGIGLMASPLVGRLGSANMPNAQFLSYVPWIAAACAIAVAGLAVGRWQARADTTLRSILTVSVTLFSAFSVGLLGHETLGRSSSGVDLVAPIKAILTPDMPIYSVRLLDHTVPFYLQRTTIMVEAPDELEFGVQQEPRKWLPTLAAFQSAWSSGKPAVAIMSHDTYAVLRKDNVVMFPVAKDTRRVVVANFPGRSP